MKQRQPQFADLNGIVTHYRLSGRPAGVPLVFVNSLGADLRIWDGLVPHFEADHLVIRYDKRGHGLTACPPAPYLLADFVQDLAALLEHLDIEACRLVGISIGGMVAMQYALEFPEKVRALVLADTAARIGAAAYWEERIGRIREQGMVEMASQILPRWFGETFINGQAEAYAGYLNMLARAPEEGYVGACAALAAADLRDAVRSLQVDTLVLAGAEDPATTPELVRAFAESVPGARFQEISQAGHHPCIENPSQMAAVMSQFFTEKSNA